MEWSSVLARDQGKDETDMSDEYVWVTDAHIDARLTKDFVFDRLFEDKDSSFDAMGRHEIGKYVGKNEYPPYMWPRLENRTVKSLPHLFKGGGFWTVSTQFADVLRQFDLGKTELHPVELYKRDKKTRLEGSYEFLSCCEVKDGFEAAYSNRFHTSQYQVSEQYALLELAPKDFDISVNASVLGGADLWFDSYLQLSFFFSDRLVRAFKAKKLTSRMRLFKVKIIKNN